MFKSRNLARNAFCLTAIAAALTAPTQALAVDLQRTLSFAIRPEELSAALVDFSRQAKIQVMWGGLDLKDRKSSGLHGQYSIAQAMNLLLAGSGLSFKDAGPNTIALVASASAADPAAAVAADAGQQGTTEIAQVVVTARRRAENSQTVPIAITTFSARDLQERHITNQTDLADNTPSVVSLTGGQPVEYAGFAIRGQGPAFGAVPGTVSYFADVPTVYGIEGRPGTYYDLGSVQVLKGPQGTLFGKNATGGNILFAPQAPTENLEGYVQTQFGNYADRAAEGAVNLPLFNKFALLRISGRLESRRGYTSDVGPDFGGKDYDNLDYQSMRAELMLNPHGALQNYTIFRAYHSRDNGPGTSEIAINTSPTAGSPPFLLDAFFPNRQALLDQQLARGPRQVAYDINQYAQTLYTQGINTTTWKLGDALSVKNIVSYSRDYNSYGYDYDASTNAIAGQTSPGEPTTAWNTFTEELQLQGDALDRDLHYTAGFYTDRSKSPQADVQYFTAFPTSTVLTAGAPLQTIEHIDLHSRALYAQGTYKFDHLVPVLKGLSLTAGYRYTYDTETEDQLIVLAPPAQGGASKFHYGSYTFDLDYQVNPATMVYATARKAYKAGGANINIPSDSPDYYFKPEALADEEVGIKSQFDLVGGMKARTNLDLFYGNYTNIQRTTPTVVSGVVANLTQNAAQATVQGLEFEGTLIPLKRLELSLAYSYLDSKYTKVTDANAASILQGSPFPYAPRNKYTVGARYWYPLPGEAGRVEGSAHYSYQSQQSVAQSNQTQFPWLAGYGVLNARLDWKDIYGQPLDLGFFVSNALNKLYATGEQDFYNTAYGFVTRTYGEPRMFGVQLSYSFGS